MSSTREIQNPVFYAKRTQELLNKAMKFGMLITGGLIKNQGIRLRSRINNMPIPQKMFNVRTVSAVWPSSVTNNF